MTVSATTTRVPVQNGHTESISVGLEQQPPPDAIIDAWTSFRGRPQELELPSAPPQPIVYLTEANRPQPLLDVNRDGGMTVTVGRLRPCPVLDYKFVALGPQHDSRRRRRRDSQRRAHAPRGAAVNVIMVRRHVGGRRRSYEIRRHVGRRSDAIERLASHRPRQQISRGGGRQAAGRRRVGAVEGDRSADRDRPLAGDGEGDAGDLLSDLLERHLDVASGVTRAPIAEALARGSSRVRRA